MNNQLTIFASNLNQLLSIHQKQQNEVAKAINVPVTTFNAWCNGQSLPRMGNVQKLADYFNVKKSYLIEKHDSFSDDISLNEFEKNVVLKYRKLDSYSQKAVNSLIDIELQRQNDIIKENITPYENIKTLPLYPQLVSAGTGQYVVDDIPANTIDVDGNIYRTATYAITVSGDSMQPTYYDGDILIVDRQSVPDDNEVGIFIVDGMGYVKRKGEDELISDNKAYPNVKGNEGLCMGKVLGRI